MAGLAAAAEEEEKGAAGAGEPEPTLHETLQASEAAQADAAASPLPKFPGV